MGVLENEKNICESCDSEYELSPFKWNDEDKDIWYCNICLPLYERSKLVKDGKVIEIKYQERKFENPLVRCDDFCDYQIYQFFRTWTYKETFDFREIGNAEYEALNYFSADSGRRILVSVKPDLTEGSIIEVVLDCENKNKPKRINLFELEKVENFGDTKVLVFVKGEVIF